MSSDLQREQQRIGKRYVLERQLGAGAMGDVFLARHAALGRKVALKLLKKPLAAGPMLERFRRETQVTAQLRHDHVVDIIDCGATSDGTPFLVMELLEGAPLDEVIRARGGTLPVHESCELALQMLAGLSHSHSRGVVHRDLKPANLFLTARYGKKHLKLLDFGLAKLLETITGVTPLEHPTQDGMVLGTPAYMAPEQFGRAGIDVRADVYASGAILYRMLSGRLPFEERSIRELLEAHATRSPPPPSTVAPQPIDTALDAVVMKALARYPADRFQTAIDFSMALFEYTGGYERMKDGLGLTLDGETPEPTIAAAPAAITANPTAGATVVTAGRPHPPAPPQAAQAPATAEASLEPVALGVERDPPIFDWRWVAGSAAISTAALGAILALLGRLG